MAIAVLRQPCRDLVHLLRPFPALKVAPLTWDRTRNPNLQPPKYANPTALNPKT